MDVSALPFPTVVYSADTGLVLRCNVPWSELTGFQEDEIQSKPFTELIQRITPDNEDRRDLIVSNRGENMVVSSKQTSVGRSGSVLYQAMVVQDNFTQNTFFNSVVFPLTLYDVSGNKYLWVSKGFCDLLQREKEELLTMEAMDPRISVPPLTQTVSEDRLYQELKANPDRDYCMPWTHVRPDGVEIPCECHTWLVEDVQLVSPLVGSLPPATRVYWVAITRNLVYSKAYQSLELSLKESERMYRELILQAPDAILLLDPKKRCYTMANPAAEKLFECDSYTLCSTPPGSFSPEYQPDGRISAVFFARYLQQAIAGEKVEQEWAVITSKGNMRTCQVHIQYLSESLQSLRVCMIDVSERKRHTADLRRANELLRQAKQEADQANSAKSTFLACMTHELRTPLSVITAATEVLDDIIIGDEARKWHQLLEESSLSLAQLIDDILDLSKVESGEYALEEHEFNMADLLELTERMMAVKASAKKLTLNTIAAEGVGKTYFGDPMRVRQILVNLISNSIKFTPEGGVITVRLEAVDNAVGKSPTSEHKPSASLSLLDAPDDPMKETSGTFTSSDSADLPDRTSSLSLSQERLRITISDTGIGIAPEDQQHMFDMFTQADSTRTRKFGGTGLGLYICKRLSEAMGGGIVLDSDGEGHGATVVVELVFRVAEGKHNQPVHEDVHRTKAPLYRTNPQSDVSPGETPLLRALPERPPQANQQFGGDIPSLVLSPSSSREGTERQMEAEHVVSAATSPPISPSAPKTNRGKKRRKQKRRVLLVEDNSHLQFILSFHLTSAGHHVDVAENGQVAVDMCTKHTTFPWDVILMDMQMPVMDGLEATKRIRAHEKSIKDTDVEGNHNRTVLPIIALSALALSSLISEWYEAGITSYVPKPVLRRDLIAVVESTYDPSGVPRPSIIPASTHETPTPRHSQLAPLRAREK